MTVPPRSAPSGLVHAVVATSAATSVVENVNDLAFDRSMAILGCWAGNSRRGRMHTRCGPVPLQRFGSRIGDRKSVVQGKGVSVGIDFGGRGSIKKPEFGSYIIYTLHIYTNT